MQQTLSRPFGRAISAPHVVDGHAHPVRGDECGDLNKSLRLFKRHQGSPGGDRFWHPLGVMSSPAAFERRFSVRGNGMMDVSRRGFFQRASGATVISIGAMAAPVVLGQRPKKVSQDELSEAIVNHRAWLEDQGKGTRTVFNNRDLSGLHFTSGDGSMVNLRGADFTGSDMTGVTGT